MLAWLDQHEGEADLNLNQPDYAYDFRGQLSTVTTYQMVNANGVGINEPASPASTIRYIYDAQGSLLQSTALRVVGSHPRSNSAQTEAWSEGFSMARIS